MKKKLIESLALILVALPFKLQLKLGYLLGIFLYIMMSRRRKIVLCNLRHCFPELDAKSITKLCYRNFQSVGMGMMESLAAWFMSERRIKKIPATWVGREHFVKACHSGKGVLVLSGHTLCMEIVGRLFNAEADLNFVYKPSHNETFNNIMIKGRLKATKTLFKHENLKAMVTALKKGKFLWFAPDQDFGRVRAVFAPFFNRPAATVTAASLIAKLGNATVIPVFFKRTVHGYELTSLPIWDNFPSGDDLSDAKRYNDLLTQYVRTCPEQYLWMHRRFKTTQSGENIYQENKSD